MISLDDQVMTTPVIESRICGPHLRITIGRLADAQEDKEQAVALSHALKAGASPCSLRIVAER